MNHGNLKEAFIFIEAPHMPTKLDDVVVFGTAAGAVGIARYQHDVQSW
jgi:hypothetical protein